jgi:hypothetical protein
LPASLGGGEPLDIAGRVRREVEAVLHAGNQVYSTAIRFHALDTYSTECRVSVVRKARPILTIRRTSDTKSERLETNLSLL